MNFSLNFKIAILFFLITFLGSIVQSIYTYDSFHWVISQSSIDLFSSRTPYKDFFIHYGFLFTLVNAIILKIFNYDLLSTMIIASLFYGLGNFNIYLISKKFVSPNLNFYVPITLFLLHPFANHPWPNYQFYFFLTLFILMLLKNNLFNIFISGFLLSLCCLTYENFIFLSPVIILILLFILKDLYKNILFILGFVLPISIFHLYLYLNNLHDYWLRTFNLNSVFLEIYNLSLIDLILGFFIKFTKISIGNIFTESYFFFFFILIVLNCVFVLIYFSKILKKEKFTFNEKILFIISIISILTIASAFHKINIFRFSTGPILGIIIFFYIIEKNFYNFKNYIIIFSIFLIASSSLVPYKKSNNKFFLQYGDVKYNVNNKEINFFKSQRWNEDTWKTLIKIRDLSFNLSKCNNIKSFLNLTTDGYTYMLANKYLNSRQYIFWYDNERYYKLMFDNYEININQLILNSSIMEDTIIFINQKNLNHYKERFNLSNFRILDLPYSYQHKRVHLIYPLKCK